MERLGLDPRRIGAVLVVVALAQLALIGAIAIRTLDLNASSADVVGALGGVGMVLVVAGIAQRLVPAGAVVRRSAPLAALSALLGSAIWLSELAGSRITSWGETPGLSIVIVTDLAVASWLVLAGAKAGPDHYGALAAGLLLALRAVLEVVALVAVIQASHRPAGAAAGPPLIVLWVAAGWLALPWWQLWVGRRLRLVAEPRRDPLGV